MITTEEKLIGLLSTEGQGVISLCQELVRRPSEDPSGDTREIAEFIYKYCKEAGVECEIVSPHPEKPNVVIKVRGAKPGPHVVFNGHMDTFPVGDTKRWHHDPFGGEIVDGLLYGRGSADMKGGLSSCIYSAIMLNCIKDRMSGSVSVTCVSDEEVFGPWGTKHLLANFQDLHGDVLINGEPSSLNNIRIGEKGQYWFHFSCKAEGGHAAYAAVKNSAVQQLMNLLNDLSNLPEELNTVPNSFRLIMEDARENYDGLLFSGATDAALCASMNIGKMQGGLSVNMIPEHCVAEVDFRLPPGVPGSRLRRWIETTLKNYPSCTTEEYDTQDSYLTELSEPIVQIALEVAQEVLGEKVYPTFSLGGTEARMWRKLGVPAITYGPNHHNMGSPDEYIVADELLSVLKVHALTALRFMQK